MLKSILIVEDDNLLRDLTAKSLSTLYAVHIVACANADEALHWLAHYQTRALVSPISICLDNGTASL